MKCVTKKIIEHFKLDTNLPPQTFGLGIKETWQIDPLQHNLGTVEHFIGYPLYNNAYGGGFIYHAPHNYVSIGLISALDYKNPSFSPYEEFQKFKHHPYVAKILTHGKRIGYGARAIVEGGVQSIPKLTFPGGVLVGDCAGFVNVARTKGIHNAIKSGILASEYILHKIISNTIISYDDQFKQSVVYEELYNVRNIRPSFKLGFYFGLLYTIIERFIFFGHVPWTFKWIKKDNERTLPRNECDEIKYNTPDGVISFDKASSIYLSNINHHNNTPCHLKLKNPDVAIKINAEIYQSPEVNYCPAGVYEIRIIANNKQLQINAQNCIHCKACDIKDPTENIIWCPPEGGSGPQYIDM